MEKIYLHAINANSRSYISVNTRNILKSILQDGSLLSLRLQRKFDLGFSFSGMDFVSLCDYDRREIVSNEDETYNSFNGKADMNGKNYLIELMDKNYPVIKTIDNLNYIDKLPHVNKYVIKPKDGADSIGMEFLSKEELYKNINSDDNNTLIQPLINFKYEVSFYFIDKEFQYALYAPDKNKRWELKVYTPTKEDLEFAQKFIEWNNLEHGIQRVDACRTEENELLLVELEDLNPYLSLLEISDELRNKFVDSLKNSLRKVLASD